MKVKDLVPFKREREGAARREDAFYALHGRMHRLFDELMGDFGRLSAFPPIMREDRYLSPRVDLSEDDKEVVVTAELPGMGEKDVELSLTDDELSIKGEKKSETEEKNRDYFRSERVYGAFFRTIPLPSPVDRDKAEAVFKDGVLKVRLPKTAPARETAKRIEVKKG